MIALESLGTVIESDILVVGGGASGMWTANKAREYVENVLVVDKGPLDWGGLVSLAGGDFDAVLPDENVDDFVKDLVYYYDGLCPQDLIEEMFKHSYARLQDYQQMGCEFLTDTKGRLRGIPQRSLNHIKLYPCVVTGNGGKYMSAGLLQKAKNLGVKRLGRILITEFIKQDGRIAGAIGFHTISGEFYIFKTKAVVITAGAGGWKASYNLNTSTGEGIHTAFRAGAELGNFEFIEVWNQPRLFAWEGQTTLLPLGARFVNAKGDYFMDRYAPKLGSNTDPHFNVIGMAIEKKVGRGPIYFDTSKIEYENMSLVEPLVGWRALNHKKLMQLEIDFFHQKTEWIPQVDISFGGLSADIDGKTQVPGLYVAGRARYIDPGVYLGGFALFVTAVTGYITGKVAAEYSKEQSKSKLDNSQIKDLKTQLFAPLQKTGIPPKEILREIQEIIFSHDVSILKSESSLNSALNNMEILKNELLPQMIAADPHQLLKMIEVQAIAFISEIYLRTSLMRKESRAGHYRVDFPNRDDANWLKWINISLKDGKTEYYTKPVPFEKYKFKLEKCYSDNFKFKD